MNKKIIIGIIVFFSTVLLVSGGYIGFSKYTDYKDTESIEKINTLLDEKKSKTVCKEVLFFDQKKAQSNKQFKSADFNRYKETCEKSYNIKYIEKSLDTCKDIIKGNSKDYSDRYILLDTFDIIQQECSEKYLKITFDIGRFFDVNNDFKSIINLDFSLPFYTDVGTLGSDEYINNRTEAKKRLISLLDVSPNVEIQVDDIILYPKKGIINLALEPITPYEIRLKAFTNNLGDLETKEEFFTFTTPENKFLGIQIENPVSLYMDTKPPEFELIKYNLENKDETTLKICRIDNENYAKIEILRGRKEAREEMKDFFINGIDKLSTYDCKEKTIDLGIGKTIGNTNNLLLRKKISFDDEIGAVARSGLYYVTFSNKKDRNINDNLQFPIFFGIVDSHITMKVSKNGEGYFFVNDFSGNPLPEQEIRVYINKFISHTSRYNSKTKMQDLTYNSPLDTSVLGKEVLLGKTNEEGVLQVDLRNKIEGAFDKTFSAEWNYKFSGINESFFVTAASKSHLTYNHSHWNAGIAPWNFGYKVDSDWYGSNGSDDSTPTLLSWGNVEKEFYSHIYTDRVLYLPGEEVNIKAIVRESKDLTIPQGKEFEIIVKNSKNRDVLITKLKLSEYGSLSEKFKLDTSAMLGSYTIIIKDSNGEYARGYFSVEVFKNPKFKNDISLKTIGLNGEDVKIDEKIEDKNTYGYKKNIGKFSIKAGINSKYYNGGILQNATFTYKVYKQYHYDSSYWDDCYWGCFWEPEKVFYTEGKGNLDVNGKTTFDIDVAFESSYEDYKYIVEVTVTDKSGDIITGSNSIIAKLPSHLKNWNSNADLKFETPNNYYQKGKKIKITGGLSQGKWTKDYDNKYIFIIKKKDYKTNYIDDVRGYKRPVNVVEERIEKVTLVSGDVFNITDDGKLELDFIPNETGEYVFEYGKINQAFFDIPNGKNKGKELLLLIDEFNKEKKLELNIGRQELFLMDPNYDVINYLNNNCDDTKKMCSHDNLRKTLECQSESYISGEVMVNEKCNNKNSVLSLKQKVSLSTLLGSTKKYFTILSYGNEDALNPVLSDNKIRVLSEKVNYKLGETAKVLIRLPFSKGKILWTVEKQGVIKKEYIDVSSNMFFKEILVDDTFVPNAYVSVLGIPTGIDGAKKDDIITPEYKVGYTEIVVDKSDKKSFIEIKSNKKKYKPREKVVLDITNTLANKIGKQSELTVMVVDDSLISLMGNVDINTLEKFYKKLPFQIQTSLTNLAMLKNYYFSRPGIVGGSGFGNFKGGDSAVNTRTIFKNTAYFNPNIITNQWGSARVEFELPDNLTNFRVMVVSNSRDNFFGYNSEIIEVRKNIVIEDKTPLIYRIGDRTEVSAQIFNQTDKEIGFKVKFESEDIMVNKSEKLLNIPANSSEVVTFWTRGALDKNADINYKILALGDSVENSDILEKTIKNKEFPSLTSIYSDGGLAEPQKVQNLKIDIPENTDLEKSMVKISFSNNVLQGIDKTLKSLLVYPYGCIEQTVSSTYPNAVLLNFSNIFPNIISKEEAEKNLEVGINRISSMQLSSGGFAYWQGDLNANLHITPYVLRRLIDMKEMGAKVPENMIKSAQIYLEMNFSNITDNIDRVETFYAFAKMGEGEKVYKILLKDINTSSFSRHELIAYTYGLIAWDKIRYKDEIDKNIIDIMSKLDDTNSNYRYWSARSDKALFTSMLLDYNYNYITINKYIEELYSVDWSNYYYSTTAKNNSFMAFAKYMEKYGRNSSSNFSFSIGAIHNRDKRFILGGEKPNTVTREFKLKDIMQYKEDYIELTSYVLSGKSMFTNITLEAYPEDKFAIKELNNGMKVERNVFEVLDINKIADCSAIYYWRDKKPNCDNVLRRVEDNIYTKGKYYKIGIKVSFDEDKQRRNIALEDYIPSTFKIINSKFKTEMSAVKKGNNKSGSWDHVEYLEDKVFANASNVWGNDLYFEYMVTPQFEGHFIYPPVSAYMMYDGDIRAHSKFEKIEVREKN